LLRGESVAAAKAKDLANAEAENAAAICLLFLFHTGLILIPNPITPKVDISL
jgi:hypothetical protein